MDRSNALGREFKITRASSDIYCATVCASRDYSYLAEGNILMEDSRPAVEPSTIVADLTMDKLRQLYHDQCEKFQVEPNEVILGEIEK